MPGQPVNYVPIAIICLFVWRIYSRVRRTIARQRVTPGRMIARIVIYAILTLLFAVVSILFFGELRGFASLIAGVAGGAGLALIGLQLTRFETTPEGRFYTPNPYMGVGLSVLLIGRILYRVMVVSSAAQSHTQPQLMQSPLTYFFYGLLAGYYMAFFTGVLLRSRAG